MTGRVDVVVLDVNETLSDMEPLRGRFSDVGAPEHLLDTWFASTLRDGFGLAASGTSRTFPEVGAAVLRGLLSALPGLRVPVEEAVGHVLAGFPTLGVHPDVPAGLQHMADAGLRLVTLTNGSLSLSEQLLERAGIAALVERRLSVDDAGRWKPHPDAYAYAARQCDVPLERCAMLAVHPWDLGGAGRAGMTTGWIDRHASPWPQVFAEPDVRGSDLSEVARSLVRL